MAQGKSTGRQITEGVIWKQLLAFFFPILLGTFFQQLYNTVDMVIVGRFVGKVALASVGGSSGQTVNLIVGFFTGLSGGAGVIVSQFYGANDKRNLNLSLQTAYAFSLVGGVVFTVLGIALTPAMLRLMNTSEELLGPSGTYLRIYFAGIIFVFIYNIGSGILRALGDSRRPLYYLICCCLINIVLDLIMVAWLKLGVAGVAVATTISQAVSAVMVTRALTRSEDIYRLELRKISFHWRILKSQLYIGLPGGIQSVMYSLSNIVIQSVINVFGTNATAAWAAEGKLDAVFWMINGAFGIAITTFVGQNYGAGRYDRMKKGVWICLGMHQLFSAAISISLFTFRAPLFSIFTQDADVVRIGSDLMRVIAPCYAVFSFVEIFSGALRAVGDVVVPMFLTMFGICLFRVGWMFTVVPAHRSLDTIVLSYPISWIMSAVLFILYFLYRKRRWNGAAVPANQ